MRQNTQKYPKFIQIYPKLMEALYQLISIARYFFKSPSICFWATKYDVYCECVANLHSKLWRRAQLWLELFASTVDRVLSRVSYLPSYVFLRRRRSFASRKVYACLEKFLCFLQLCFWSSMYGFIPPSIVLVPQDSNIALYAQVCWLCCVFHIHAIVLLSSGKTMVSILHVADVDLISCRYF